MSDLIQDEVRASEARNWLYQCAKRVKEAEQMGKSASIAQVAYLISIKGAITVVKGAHHAEKMMGIMSEQYFKYQERWPELRADLMRNIGLNIAA